VELSQLWEKRKERVRDEFSHHGLSCQCKEENENENGNGNKNREM
jgi:hypothetical protein